MPVLLELFAGTQSVSRAFSLRGWTCLTLDLVQDPHAEPLTYQTDILTWDFTNVPRPDCIWASPPCTEYSIARTTGGPRNYALADAIVQKTLEIIHYLQPRVWFIENPATGYLHTRDFMQALPEPRLISYCQYGFPYRKNTHIWSNEAENPDWETFRCPGKGRCSKMIDGRHILIAQRGQTDRAVPNLSTRTLYRIPPSLCAEIADFATDICATALEAVSGPI